MSDVEMAAVQAYLKELRLPAFARTGVVQLKGTSRNPDPLVMGFFRAEG